MLKSSPPTRHFSSFRGRPGGDARRDGAACGGGGILPARRREERGRRRARGRRGRVVRRPGTAESSEPRLPSPKKTAHPVDVVYPRRNRAFVSSARNRKGLRRTPQGRGRPNCLSLCAVVAKVDDLQAHNLIYLPIFHSFMGN